MVETNNVEERTARIDVILERIQLETAKILRRIASKPVLVSRAPSAQPFTPR